MAKLNSAVVTVLPPGVFITTVPCCVAASMSTLSTPTPARPTTRNLGAASMTLRVTLVSERTTSATASATTGSSSGFGQPFGQHDDLKFRTLLQQSDAFRRNRITNDNFHSKMENESRRCAGQGQTMNLGPQGSGRNLTLPPERRTPIRQGSQEITCLCRFGDRRSVFRDTAWGQCQDAPQGK